MPDSAPQSRTCTGREYRFVLILSVVVLAVTSVPYVLGAVLATDERVFGGFVYATGDCYSYLAKMRQGAEGAWLFRIAYTPEPHPRVLFFLFHLLLGKVAALLPGGDLTAKMIWVYHAARVICGLALLLTVYRFLAVLTARVAVRRLAWLMVTCGGGLGWLLVALGQPGWLGSMPLDFILPEGFTFLVLYGFPHIALARSLLLWGVLFLLRAWGESPRAGSPERGPRGASFRWALLAGTSWLLMGLIVPFYVAVAWAVMAAAWLVLALRRRRVLWCEGWLGGGAVLVSMPVVLYSAWVFTSEPVYKVWSAQNLVTSPHPLHYLAAYGLPLALACFGAKAAWRDERPGWLALAWVGLVPFLVYLPFNLQRRLVEGVQIPLSLLAATGLLRTSNFQLPTSNLRSKLVIVITLIAISLTNVMLVAGNALTLLGRPAPVYRDAGEVAALDWLDGQVGPDDVVLAAYATGNYLPARCEARSFVGHGPETVRFDEKNALVARFFDPATDDAWRQQLLAEYGVDDVFWGPAERSVGDFDLAQAAYLEPLYAAEGYVIFEVVQ